MTFSAIAIVVTPIPAALYLFFIELLNLLHPKHKSQFCLGWNLGTTIVVLALLELGEIVLLCLRQSWYVSGLLMPVLFVIIIVIYMGVDELLERNRVQHLNIMHFSALMEHMKEKIRHRSKSKTAQE